MENDLEFEDLKNSVFCYHLDHNNFKNLGLLVEKSLEKEKNAPKKGKVELIEPESEESISNTQNDYGT